MTIMRVCMTIMRGVYDHHEGVCMTTMRGVYDHHEGCA